ncbi:MAG: type II toxin-antitoxin system RelE/ParE family toxin [Clostridia bacterium]|nr:type II toxin-antitoxin system RelE/ParE family toxin [Clostridia bacterium]
MSERSRNWKCNENSRLFCRNRRRRKEKKTIQKKYEIRIEPLANSDYKNISYNLEIFSNNAKKRFRKKFTTIIKDLQVNPYIYQCFNKDIDENIRRVVINKYILFYKIETYKIIILRILPEKFDYLNHLEKYKILIRK